MPCHRTYSKFPVFLNSFLNTLLLFISGSYIDVGLKFGDLKTKKDIFFQKLVNIKIYTITILPVFIWI